MMFLGGRYSIDVITKSLRIADHLDTIHDIILLLKPVMVQQEI